MDKCSFCCVTYVYGVVYTFTSNVRVKYFFATFQSPCACYYCYEIHRDVAHINPNALHIRMNMH